MKQIIVADDSNIIVSIVRKALEGKYEVLSASNGQEAIDIIKTHNLDEIVCMLLDLNMPEVDGFAVLEYLQANNLFRTVPVSIITGDDDMDVVERAFQYNVIDMLKKPFNVDTVNRIVEKTVSITSINNM